MLRLCLSYFQLIFFPTRSLRVSGNSHICTWVQYVIICPTDWGNGPILMLQICGCMTIHVYPAIVARHPSGLLSIVTEFVKASMLFCFLTIFISLFYIYMPSLQNIHTISEEKSKEKKAPSKRKSSVLKDNNTTDE